MKKRQIIVLIFLTLILQSEVSGQHGSRFVVNKEGIEPIILPVDSISSTDLYKGVLTWAKTNIGDGSVTELNDKSIAVRHVWKNLLTTHLKTGVFTLDMDFSLGIKPDDKQLNLSVSPGQFWIAGGQRKKAEFSYEDLFKKNGEVIINGMPAKDRLEINLNNLTSHMINYLKKNFITRLRKNEFEWGYVKEGKRISVWQYFDDKRQPELTINYLTGRILYIRPDTSFHFVFYKQKWSRQRLDISPVPLSGTHNFYEDVKEAMSHPSADCPSFKEDMIFTFEVDSAGVMTNRSLLNGIGDQCDSAMLRKFKSVETLWAPAKIGKLRVKTRFLIPLVFGDEGQNATSNYLCSNDKEATCLEPVVVLEKKKTFMIVEKSAEPVGGLAAFYKWVDQNLRYPESAKRWGVEGKTFVKFVIERSGEITNVEIVKGFNDDCDKEAVRLISTMPKWNPGMQHDILVRQAYTLPIAFRLAK